MTQAQTTQAGRDPVTIEVAVALARRWRMVIGVPVAAAVLALVVLLLTPNSYRSVTSFVPETHGRAGGAGALAGLAAAAGIQLGTGDPGQTPQFYADLLSSTPIVYGVLRSRFAGLKAGAAAGADSLALVDYLEPGAEPLDARLERAAKTLGSMSAVSVDRPTGVVRVAVMAPRPALAAAIASQYVTQLIHFNQDSRQSQARSRRVFAQARAAEAAQALESAESALRAFTERNRVATSPSLRFEEGRLQRQVAIRQDLYMSLNRELEVARINEADESPALTVIEPALAPTVKAAPNRRRTLIGVTIVMLGLTMSWVVFYEMQRDRLHAGAAMLDARARPFLPGRLGRPRSG